MCSLSLFVLILVVRLKVNEGQVSQVECKCRIRLEKKYTLGGINGVHRSLETVWIRSFVPLVVESLMTFC